MSSPNELTVLRTAQECSIVTKRKIGHKMGINTEYAGYLLEYLSKKGLLAAISPGRFELTRKGEDALLYQLHHIKAILTAKAYGTIRQIDSVNKKMGDYEDYVKGRTIEEFRNA